MFKDEKKIQRLQRRLSVNSKALLEVIVRIEDNPDAEADDVAEAERLTDEIEADTAELAAEKTKVPKPANEDDDEIKKPDAKKSITEIQLEEKQMTGPAIVKSDKNKVFNLNHFVLALADKSYRGGGYEIEMSQEAARLSGKDSSTAIIPWGALANKAQDSITAPSGGSDVGMSLAQPRNHDDLFTITSAASFQASAAGQLGVGIYQAPLGAFKVPRMVQPLVPEWVARDANVPNTTGRFDSLDAAPKTLGGVCEIRRSALIDTAPPMQTVISDAIWAAVLNALDNALLGAPLPADPNQPAGMYQALATGPNDFGLLDNTELLFAMAGIADLNGGDPLQFIASNVWGAYAQTSAVSALLSQKSLLDSMPVNYARSLNGRMSTFDNVGTPTPPQRNLRVMFGPWSTYVATVLFGSGVEIAINPNADSVFAKGAILVRCMVDADILIRDASRFGMGFQDSDGTP